MSPQTVLLRTTLTWTITIYRIIIITQNVNPLESRTDEYKKAMESFVGGNHYPNYEGLYHTETIRISESQWFNALSLFRVVLFP